MTAVAFKPAREVANARRWADEDAQESRERDVAALAISIRESEAETQKLARAKAQQDKHYSNWDKLRESEAFKDYLIDRRLKLRDLSKGLPRNSEMEQAALGAMMMLQSDPVTTGMRRLHPRHFDFYFDTPLIHARIFIAITRLESARQANPNGPLRSIDFLSVHEELSRMGGQEIPVAYLIALIEGCPSFVNIDHYISVVIEKSRLRHLFTLGELLQDAIREPDADAGKLGSAAAAAAAAINEHGWCDLKSIFNKENQ